MKRFLKISDNQKNINLDFKLISDLFCRMFLANSFSLIKFNLFGVIGKRYIDWFDTSASLSFYSILFRFTFFQNREKWGFVFDDHLDSSINFLKLDYELLRVVSYYNDTNSVFKHYSKLFEYCDFLSYCGPFYLYFSNSKLLFDKILLLLLNFDVSGSNETSYFFISRLVMDNKLVFSNVLQYDEIDIWSKHELVRYSNDLILRFEFLLVMQENIFFFETIFSDIMFNFSLICLELEKNIA